MATELDLQGWLQARAAALHKPAFLKSSAELIVSSVIRSFQLGGRTSGDIARPFDGGTVKWRPVNTAYGIMKAKNGKAADGILLYTGRLRNSVQWQITATGIELGTNLTYAAIHQFGGEVTITPRSRSYFRFRAATAKTKEEVSFWIGMSRKRGNTIRMPARPFLTIQAEDIEDIQDIAIRHIDAES